MAEELAPVAPAAPTRRVRYPRTVDDKGIMEIGYKVVRSTGEGRFPTHMGQVVTYTPGKVITPQEGHGPLAVFTSFEAAKRFCMTSTYRQAFAIYEVAYVPSKEETYWMRSCAGRRISTRLKYAPQGKAAATSLIMLKLVYIAPYHHEYVSYGFVGVDAQACFKEYVRAHNALVDEHPEFIPEFGSRIIDIDLSCGSIIAYAP